jgi:glycosyltransferase 2 family protein
MSHAPRTRGWKSVALRAGGSLAILALLLAVLPRERVWAAMRSVPPLVWLAVLAGYMAGHVIGVIKYRMMVNLAGAGLSYPQAAQCYFGGLFGTLFLPSIVGGDLVRAGLGLRMARHRTGFLLGSLIDRMLDITALALVAGFGALLLPGELEPRSRRVFIVLLIFAAVGAAAAILAAALLPVSLVPYKFRRRLVRLRQAARSMRRSPLTVMFSLCGGVVVQSSFAMLTAVLAVHCGLFVRLRIWLLVWPLAKISALLPLTQGGLGVREAALAALLVPFGAPAALTVAVGLLWQTIIISGSLLSGLLALAAGRLSARASLAPAAGSRGTSPSPAVKSSVGRAVMENQPAPRP